MKEKINKMSTIKGSFFMEQHSVILLTVKNKKIKMKCITVFVVALLAVVSKIIYIGNSLN